MCDLFELETIKVFDKAPGKQFKKLSIHNAANLSLLKELPDDLYDLLLALTDLLYSTSFDKVLTEIGLK